MRRSLIGLGFLAVLAGASGTSYWLGARHQAEPAPEQKVLYYKNPMGLPDRSPVPKKDSMGMDYIPVYAKDAQKPDGGGSGSSKVLYYKNPMGLPDTSPVPKKDSMGMDYIPVYETDATQDKGIVTVSPARVQALGVRSEPARTQALVRTVTAVGTIQPDEQRLFVVNTKFDGWIDKLHVNATGQEVRHGQPLMEVYAPELVVAQQEYLLALRSEEGMKGAGADLRESAKQLAQASLERLRNWDISNDQIAQLQRNGRITRTLTLRSPADGVVLEKMAVEGMRFTAGDPLYKIADLSSVWLIADIFEQDLGALREGQDARITVDAYPGEAFTGKVAFIYPTVAQDTRTAKARIVIPNPDGRLKPGLYAHVALGAPLDAKPELTVPDSAVLDSSTKQVVLVDRGQGRFEPRTVKTGARADGRTAVVSGLKEGENVVVGANFLIDAESNMAAALNNFSAPPDSSSGTSTAKGKAP